MGIYQKMIEEAVSHTPLEAIFAKELDKMNSRLETQHNILQTLSTIMTKQSHM